MLLQNGIGFAAAADAYAKADQGREWFVLYFLLAQSLELTLKAFIVNQGTTERQLRRIGHDLTGALERADLAIVPPLSAIERPSIDLPSRWHSEQLTRYPLMQGYAIPRPRIVREMLAKVIESVYVAVWDRSTLERDRASERGLGLSVDLDAAYGD